MKILRFMPFILLLILFFPQRLPSQEKDIVQIGVSSMITPVDTAKYYQDIVDYIGEYIKKPVRMVHRRTYEEMDSMLERGEVKVAFVCSAPYVKDHDRFGVQLLAAPKVNGKASYNSYIIVHKDSPEMSFPELKGKTFAFTDPKSNTGKLYPTYLLKTIGTIPDKFFKSYMYSYSHNKSVELVAKKVVYAAAVDSLVYDYMVKTKSPYSSQTKIIKRSPPFGIPPVVVTKDIAPGLKKEIRDALFSMHKTKKGRDILNAMMIDEFVSITDSAYDSIRKMERATEETPMAVRKARNKKTLYLSVIPKYNPRILFEKYQPVLDYLSEKTSYSYELVLKKNYEETVQSLGRGDIDIAFLGPLTYLEAHAKYGVVCILKPRGTDGDAEYRSVIIKREGSTIKELSDLKGKKMAFSALKSTSGNLMPRHLLANSGIHLEDLESYNNFDYQDSVVKAVLKGQYDAGAVRDSVAAKYAGHGIEKIAESLSLPTGPLVVRQGLPPDIAREIKKALMDLNPSDSKHRSILKKFDDELKNGFTGATDDDYAGIRENINSVPQTCGRGCHPKMKL